MKKITLLTILMVLPFLTFSQGPWEFNTDGDAEGWTKTNSDALIVSGGLITLTPTGNNPKLIQVAAGIDPTTVQHIHITLINNTSNEYLRVSYPKYDAMNVESGRAYKNIDITPNSASTTYDLDLSGTYWNTTLGALVNDLQIHIKGAGNTNAIQDGTVQFDSIIVDNNITLGVDTFDNVEFSVYPNPAKTTVTIVGATNISKVELYDITGKKVLEAIQLANNQLNVESFKAGLYILKLVDANNNSTVKKLIIK